MAIPGLWCKPFRLSLLFVAAVFLLLAGCAPKVYRSSFSDDRFDLTTIRKLAIVLENKRGHNPLFGKIFMRSAFEKKRPFLLYREYFIRDDIAEAGLGEEVDAFLEISLSYSSQGASFISRGVLTYYSPTTLGAYAKLVETATGNIVWEMNYAYKSSESGHSAPLIEEVMKLAADDILDSIPLVKGAASMAGAEEPLRKPKKLLAKPPRPTKAETAKAPVTVQAHTVAIPSVKVSTSGSIITPEKETVPQGRTTMASVAPATAFSVQVGAFLEKDNMTERVSLLKGKGFSPYVSEILDAQKRLWHIVHVGKYNTRSEAEAAAKTIFDKVGVSTIVFLRWLNRSIMLHMQPPGGESIFLRVVAASAMSS